MQVEVAVRTAMEMELKIRDVYDQAYGACASPVGKRFFAMMRDDEQYHHDYLEKRLIQLSETGRLEYADIRLKIPSPDDLAACVQEVHQNMAVEDRGVVQQMLSNALKVEVSTSEFYEKMLSESQGAAKKMFGRFLEIENGHIAAVQAELDYVMNTGYWFDFKEFDME